MHHWVTQVTADAGKIMHSSAHLYPCEHTQVLSGLLSAEGNVPSQKWRHTITRDFTCSTRHECDFLVAAHADVREVKPQGLHDNSNSCEKVIRLVDCRR